MGIEIVPIIVFGTGGIIAVTAILTTQITNYKIQVEQIKADAMVRAEEVRARNQLELEKLMNHDKVQASNQHVNKIDTTQGYMDIKRSEKEKA